jgi:hypothetical protein
VTHCDFEEEVLAAALESRWPQGVDAPLREHAGACATCSEVALAARAIRQDRQDLCASAPIPDSGRVWRQAQLRARREAIAAADRPITIVHMITFACAAGLLGACFGATSEWFQATLKRILANPLAALFGEHLLLGAGMAAALLLLPAAAYFALARETPALPRQTSGSATIKN